MSIQTLNELFLKAASYKMPDCLQHKTEGRYRPISTSDLVDRVQRLAKALQELGVQKGDRLALMAENGPHWPTVDFATLCSGAVLVPIYPTLTPNQAAYIINDCGARIVFVESIQRLQGLLSQRHEMPSVTRFVLIGGGDTAGTTTLEQLLLETDPMSDEEFEASARASQPDDVATFIYTSGTTGDPKGVVLTHRNIASNVLNSLQMMDLDGGWTALSFLPLSHSFERMVDYIYFYKGVSIAYAESVQAVAKNFLEVNPHVFVS
ncbi:MAG: AMP-binding protein, partial [Thermoanaerobaculia bacterium]